MVEVDEDLPEGQWMWHDPFPAEIYVMGRELEASFYKVMFFSLFPSSLMLQSA